MAQSTVLVTGGTAGIGLEVARALAEGGARVVVTGRDEQRGAATVDDLRRRAGHDEIEFISVDQETVGGNQGLAARLDERLDRLDVLVNNVGRVFSRREETDMVSRRRWHSSSLALMCSRRGFAGCCSRLRRHGW